MPPVRKRECVRRERDQCAAGWVTKMRGMEASPRSASSGEGGVERGATLAPFSPLYDSFPTSGSRSPVDGVYDQ
jgi:hypothetical protein